MAQYTEIKTEILINATPDKVWQVLTDFKSYAEWNPFIKSLTGTVQKGEAIHVAIDGMKFKPKVLVFKTAQELRWLGHFFFKGIFDGEHHFILEDNKDGTTTFKHGEKFSGILFSLMKNKIIKDTTAGFIKMNEALKVKVELLERNNK